MVTLPEAANAATLVVPVKVGPAENTTEPAVPVSSVNAVAKLAEFGVAKKAATPAPKPDTSVPIATAFAPMVATPAVVMVISPLTCEKIDPEIAGVKVVVLTATSFALTVM